VEQEITPTREDVLVVVGERRVPLTIGGIGLDIAGRHGRDLTGSEDVPVGQRLADAGLSLSQLQKIVDALVKENLVFQVRGRDLAGNGLPTEGTKAQRRYYLHPRTVEAARATR
jgi:hypothetical protein